METVARSSRSIRRALARPYAPGAFSGRLSPSRVPTVEKRLQREIRSARAARSGGRGALRGGPGVAGRLAASRQAALGDQLEQSRRVQSADLEAIGFGNARLVGPRGSVTGLFERVINRKENPLRSHLGHRVDERRRSEVTARRQIETCPKV